MAEENAAAAPAENQPKPQSQGGQKPTLFIILAIFNMLVVAGVGYMVYTAQQQKEAQPTIDDVIGGEASTQAEEAQQDDFIGTVIPLETFVVNLSGSRGRKLARINMEIEVSGGDVQVEIDKLKPKIRDHIIIILSSKTYAEISNEDGKNNLREEIKDQLNLFLTKGQIKRVYFTEFIYN